MPNSPQPTHRILVHTHAHAHTRLYIYTDAIHHRKHYEELFPLRFLPHENIIAINEEPRVGESVYRDNHYIEFEKKEEIEFGKGITLNHGAGPSALPPPRRR